MALALVVVGAGVLGALVPPGEVAQVAEEGSVVGRPSLQLSVPDNRVGAGDRATLGVVVANSGDLDRGGPAAFERRVTTARSVELRILEEELDPQLAAGLEVRTGSVQAGQIPPGVSGPFGFELVVAPDLPAGRYTVPIEVAYEYTNIVRYSDVDEPEYRDTSREVVEEVTLVVEERGRVRVESAATEPIRRGTGTVSLLVSNVGSATVTDVGLRVQVGGGGIYFGSDDDRQRTTGLFLDRLPAGAERNVTITVATWGEATAAQYLLTVDVTYRSSTGVDRTAGPFRFGVPVNRTG